MGPIRYRRLGICALILGTFFVLYAADPARGAALFLNIPPEGTATPYVGATGGFQDTRVFFMVYIQADHPAGDGDDYLVIAHFRKGTYEETATMDHHGSGEYRTGAWYITTKRSPWDIWATGEGADPSGIGVVWIKKNAQVAFCAPDWSGKPYHWGGQGPGACPDDTHLCCFDCSGYAKYLHRYVGIDTPEDTAQGYYNSWTHLTRAELLKGDWLFFDWGNVPPHSDSIDHMGMYRGWEDKHPHEVMWHASSSAGAVVKTTLTQYYWDHSLYAHHYGANERFPW